MEAWRRRIREMTELIPADQAPEAIGELARAQEVLRIRALKAAKDRGTNGRTASEGPVLEHHLSAREVAERLRVSEDWCYANRTKLGGVKLEGAVRFPESALVQYVKSRTQATCMGS